MSVKKSDTVVMSSPGIGQVFFCNFDAMLSTAASGGDKSSGLTISRGRGGPGQTEGVLQSSFFWVGETLSLRREDNHAR